MYTIIEETNKTKKELKVCLNKENIILSLKNILNDKIKNNLFPTQDILNRCGKRIDIQKLTLYLAREEYNLNDKTALSLNNIDIRNNQYTKLILKKRTR